MSTPHKPSFRWMFNLALLFAAVLVGWFLTGSTSSTSQSTEPFSGNTRASNRLSPSKVERGDRAEAQQMVQTIMRSGHQSDRILAVIGMVDSMDATELSQWIKNGWFGPSNGYESKIFENLAMRKWARDDPEGQMAWYLEHGNELCGTGELWAARDPEGLIQFLKDHPSNKETTLLNIIAEDHPELVLNRLLDMAESVKPDMYGGFYENQILLHISRYSPELLEAHLDKLPDKLKNQAAASVLQAKLNRALPQELARLQNEPDGWEQLQRALSATSLSGAFLMHIPSQLASFPREWKEKLAANSASLINDRNAQQLLDVDLQAIGFTQEQAMQLQKRGLLTLASQDPAAAVVSMNQLELNPDERLTLISELGKQLAYNPRLLTTLTSELTSPDERELVMEVADQQPARLSFGAPSLTHQPEKWLEAATADNGSVETNISNLMNNLTTWDSKHIEQLGQQFDTMPDEAKLKFATSLSNTFTSVRFNPTFTAKAITYLAETSKLDGKNPIKEAEDSTVRFASRHAQTWGMEDPIAVSKWATQLPNASIRIAAQKKLADAWMSYDPTAAQKWLDNLPSSDRAELRAARKN